MAFPFDSKRLRVATRQARLPLLSTRLNRRHLTRGFHSSDSSSSPSLAATITEPTATSLSVTSRASDVKRPFRPRSSARRPLR